MIEHRPATGKQITSTVSLNGIRLKIANFDPKIFAKTLRERRRKRDPRWARLVKAEAELASLRK